MGMTEEDRLQLAAGNYLTFADAIRILEAEFGDGRGVDPNHGERR
jgi:hypothetical protein